MVTRELLLKALHALSAPAESLLDRAEHNPAPLIGNLSGIDFSQPFEMPPNGEGFMDGNKHYTLVKQAAYHRASGATRDEIFAFLQITNKTRCGSAATDAHLRKIAEWAAGRDVNAKIRDYMGGTEQLLEGVDIDSVQAAPVVSLPPEIPAKLMRPGGLLQSLIDSNLNTAIKPQPELALAGAIALCATIFGRKVEDDFGTRPNVYIVGIGTSGSGKDHSRRYNKRTFVECGADEMFEDDLASDAGLHVALGRSPSLLIQMDEFGRFMLTTGNPAKAPWLYKILTVLLKLYSSSGDVYAGPSYADANRNIRIRYPNCVLYGTTVPQSFFNSLTTESLSDGFFNRLLIIESRNSDPDLKTPAPFEIPYSITETVRWWLAHNTTLINDAPVARRIASSPGAVDVYREMSKTVRGYQRAEEKRGTQVWGRCYENARKLSLIHQCSLDHQATVIEQASAEWGCELALHLTQRIDVLATHYVSDGEFDQLARKLLRFVRDAGDKGRTRTEVCRHMRAQNNRQLDDLVQKLQATEELMCGTREAKSGPATTVYKAIS